MRIAPFATFLISAASVAVAPAMPQGTVELPLSPTHVDLAAGQIDLTPKPDAIAAIATLERATLVDVLLPDGSRADLLLARLPTERLGFGFQVDHGPAPGLLAGLELSVWVGTVAGRADSEVMLAFSQAGSRGWIQRGADLFHLAAVPAADGGWSRPQGLFVSDQRLLALGLERGPFCVSNELAENQAISRPAPKSPPEAAGAPSIYECKVAVETDYQLHQVFGNSLPAQTAYVTTLMTWVSYRFEEQIGTVLTYPYLKFYTNPADPWSAQDSGGNCIDVLFEFQGAWQNNIPAGGDIGHFLSGANLGCGVAWLPGLCNPPYNFSASGNINGGVSFPVQVSSGNWDFMVMAHELGHNFNGPHTHDYCPPLDQCAPPGYFGQCQTQQSCTTQGTLMSYCHLCPGGFTNITTYFHPASVADMRSWVETTCLPLACGDPSIYCTAKTNSLGCVPAIDWSGHPTLSGLDDLVVTASQVLNNQNGILFYGFVPDANPYQGGTVCVAPPVVRTPVQSSGGNPPPSDCSGTFGYAWTHAKLLAAGLSAGVTVYQQFWYRDPPALAGSGFTDALTFTVCN